MSGVGTGDSGRNHDLLARAGEYVLGLMDEEARLRAEQDIRNDPAFRLAVDRFAGQMNALDATAAPDPVPAGMWETIAARINDVQAGGSNVAAFPHSATPSPVQPPRQPLRGWAMAAALVAALAIGYFGGVTTTSTPEPVVLVILQTPAATPGAVFEAYADNSVRIVPLEDFPVPEGKIMQVWTLYDKAVGPVSLGTLPKADVVTLGAHSFPRPAANQLYEITLEPSPGSPTGKPTGPILVKGFAQQPAG